MTITPVGFPSGPAAPARPARANRSSEGGDGRRVLLWYLATRLLASVSELAAGAFRSDGHAAPIRGWDTFWYLQIASHGYPSRPTDMVALDHLATSGQWAIAFLPGYPLAIRLVAAFGLPMLVAALAISGAGGWAVAYGVYRLGTHVFDCRTGRRAAVLISAFPGALLFSMAYTEGLAIALAVGSLFALLTRRWWVGGVLGALAGAVHADIGVALVAAAFVSAVGPLRRREWRALAAPLLCPIGLLGYLAYLQVHTGSWRNWTATERTGWGQHIDFGVAQMGRLTGWLEDPAGWPAAVGLASVAVAVLLVVCLVRRPLPAPLTAFCTVALVIAFWSSAVGLRPRAFLVAAPAFVSLAAMTNGRRYLALVLAFVVATPLLAVAWFGQGVVP